MTDLCTCGWQITVTRNPPDILISEDGEPQRFRLFRYSNKAERRYSDIADTLNELFLWVVYELTLANPKISLLHAAGSSLKSENIIALGPKKSGKSVWSTMLLLQGGRYFGDDLIGWNKSKGDFVALGIGPRLRRPVIKQIIDYTKPEDFIVGKRVAYLKTSGRNIRPCAERFSIDKAVRLDNHQVQEIRWPNIFNEIIKAKIANSFLEEA